MKRHLLFALATLFATVGFAQKDVTAQYITNATLSDGTNGWTNVNFNAPQRGNNTVGYASECYEGWNAVEKSEYSLTQTITLPAGHYTLVNYSFFRHGEAYNTDASKSLAYLKAGDNQVAVKTLGSISANGYANSQVEGANAFDSKMYRNTVDFTIDADGTEIEIGLYGTFDTSITRSWMICGMFELIDNDQLATMDSPFDVTGYITNPGFEYRDMTGWTVSPAGYFGTQNNNQGFKVGGYYAEKWQASGALPEGNMKQTLTDLPAGYYKLTANLGGNGTYVDLNGKTAAWTSDKDYTVGYVLAEGEDLTITAGKTAEGTANWIHFDNFRLQFCGDVAAALTTLCEKVTDYEGKIPSAAYSNLQTEVNAKNQTYSEVDELLAAIDAVQELYDAADLLVAPYAAWQEAVADTELPEEIVAPFTSEVDAATTAAVIEDATAELIAIEKAYSDWKEVYDYAEALVDVPNDNEEANNTLGTAITDQNNAVENATTAEEYANAAAALKAAMVTYAGVANPTSESDPFDLTFMLTNPDITDFWDGVVDDANSGTWGVAPEGWYTDQEGGNFQVMANAGMAPGEIFIEYWSGTAATSGFMLYQKVTLPQGTYQMTGRLGAAQYDVNGQTTAITFSANDVDGTALVYGPLQDCSLEFVNNTDGTEVKIGMKAQAGNNNRWVGINKIHLYKTVAASFTIDETAAWDNTIAGAGDVELKRTIKVGMNTVVLPFQLTAEDLVTLGGEGAVAYTVSAYNAATDNLTFATVTEVQANTPFFLNATQAGTEYSFEGKTVVAGEPEFVTSDGACSLIGNYAASVIVPESNDQQTAYILSGGKFYKVDSAVTLKNTRFYLLVDGGSGANTLGFSFEDDATGINGIVETENAQKGIYNLQGQKVEKAVKGIYIIDGKKVLVK